MDTILIIDDEPSVRQTLETILQNSGYHILMATDGQEGLDQIARHNPDLVLLDISMPDMNGFEVLGHLRANEATEYLPVVVISAVDTLESTIYCIEKGADDYITKPFEVPLLIARVQSSLKKKHLRDELTESYQALRQAEHTRDMLTQMIVHDLNQHLTLIVGNAQLANIRVQEDPINLEALNRMHQIIQDSGHAMSSMILHILDISKLEGGQMPLSMKPINAVWCIDKLRASVQSQAEQRGIEYTITTASDDMPVMADYNLLYRVLQNLISNAFKYMRDGIRITLKATQEDAFVNFIVEDDGPGIPEDLHTKIFDKYFQIDKTSGTSESGMGLGLAFCKLAVEAQGGTIRVRSNEGNGSQFTVSLPVPTKAEIEESIEEYV